MLKFESCAVAECFYAIASNPVQLECVTAPPGPANAIHCFSISISSALLTPHSLFLSLCCIPALMELQQEDKVVSTYSSAFSFLFKLSLDANILCEIVHCA